MLIINNFKCIWNSDHLLDQHNGNNFQVQTIKFIEASFDQKPENMRSRSR